MRKDKERTEKCGTMGKEQNVEKMIPKRTKMSKKCAKIVLFSINMRMKGGTAPNNSKGSTQTQHSKTTHKNSTYTWTRKWTTCLCTCGEKHKPAKNEDFSASSPRK
jgi:hypothetical protein